MSTPERPSPPERSASAANRLQIRVVPYSPPRISSDFSVTPHSAAHSTAHSAAHSERDSSSPTPGPSSRNVEVYRGHTASPGPFAGPSSPITPLAPARLAGSPQSDKQPPDSASRRPSTASSVRRPKHVINVHADKTFSLQPQPVLDSSSSFYSSSLLTSTISSYGRGSSSSAAFGSQRQSSILAAQHEDSAPTSPESYVRPSTPHTKNLLSSASPWNYEFVGGVRKVLRETPDSRLHVDLSPSASPSPSPVYSLPREDSEQQGQLQQEMSASKEIAPKASFRASTAGTGSSDFSNFKVLEPSSPNIVLRGQTPMDFGNSTPASKANYRILGDSASEDYSLDDQSRPKTDESEPNYVRHAPAVSPSVPSGTPQSRLRSEFSRESMIVPPLNPVRKPMLERPTSSTAHKAMTPPRFIAVWSAMVRQDAARALFGSRINPPGQRGQRLTSRDRERSTYATTPRTGQFQMQSPLSTVFSESEASERRQSRSLSPFSPGVADEPSSYVLDSTPGPSAAPNSRQLTPCDESVDWPQPVYGKAKEREGGFPSLKMVGDQDEHGDGLADLTDLRDLLHHRPSRRGGFPTVLTSYPSDRNLRSSASARAYALNIASIPAWARVYYGSGEHRHLLHQASRDSMRSDYTDSQGGNSILGHTPSFERLPFSASRRRQREVRPESEGGPSVPPKRSYTDLGWAWTLKKQTSSLWSPHLRRDRRASKYHIWEPPAGFLSFEGNMATKRNLQIVLFVSGFIIPVAWIVAAFLPLPPHHDLTEKDFPSTSHIDMAEECPSATDLVKENSIHSRANWWRDLNRVMAVVGLLVIGAFAVLVALGVRQQWSA